MPKRDNAPVRNTCPDIDEVIRLIDQINDYADGMGREHDQALALMEKIRKANEELRAWGNEEHDRANELDREVWALDAKVADLKDEVESLQQELRESVNESL